MPNKMQTLIITCGEMGMGKTYLAELISKKTGIHCYEGDKALPDGMKLDTEEAVDNFVRNFLLPALKKEMATNDKVVMSQALYFQRHRELIFNAFKDCAHIKFINVATTDQMQEQNLKRRPEPFWLEYAKTSKPYFQTPPETAVYTTIKNSHDEVGVLRQLNKVFSDFPKDGSLQQFFSLPRPGYSLLILSGFMAALGVAAIAIAFTVLNAATLGIAGLAAVAIGSTAMILGGVGLFKYAPVMENNSAIDYSSQATATA